MTNPLYNKHVISISDLTRSDMELVVATAQRLKAEPDSRLLKDKLVASCFFEASTRTRLLRDRGPAPGRQHHRLRRRRQHQRQKGETLADSIKIISSYTDAVVMRHPKEGQPVWPPSSPGCRSSTAVTAPTSIPPRPCSTSSPSTRPKASWTASTSPSVGDLKYGRTVHSLAQALSLFNCRFFFISPEALAMPDYLCEELEEKGIPSACTRPWKR